MSNFLIIDGHGATDKGHTFDFKRPENTKCSIYSYTREGINIGIERSNRIIQVAIAGEVPDRLTAECTVSRINGTLVTDRILLAKEVEPSPPGISWAAKPQWYTPVPRNAMWKTIFLLDVPVDCAFVAAQGSMGPVTERTAGIVVLYIQPGHPGMLRLSTILNHFDLLPYNVIWAPCRGY